MADVATITSDQFKTVLDVSRLLTISADLDVLLQKIAQATTRLLACERASILLYDLASDVLWTRVAMQSEPIRIPRSSGICGDAFSNNRLVHVPDAYSDPRFNRTIDLRGKFVTRNLLAAPMQDIGDHPVGVVEAINKIGGDFTPLDQAMIRLLADQAGVAVQRYHLQRAAMDAIALRHEMDLARQLQESLIPKRPPSNPGMQVAGWTQPASVTGGDAFDLWRRSDGRIAVFLGDAAGHGLAPALVIAQVRTLIRALAEIHSDPATLLAAVNARLVEDLTPDRFVTAFLGYLAPDGCLQWASAGHGPIFIRLSADQAIQAFNPEMPPLGIAPMASDAPSSSAHLDRGGALIVMSDGIFEAFNSKQELFGMDRTVAALNQRPLPTADGMISDVRRAVDAWQAGTEPTDDQTIVILQCV